jgi:hypothetical protein
MMPIITRTFIDVDIPSIYSLTLPILEHDAFDVYYYFGIDSALSQKQQ